MEDQLFCKCYQPGDVTRFECQGKKDWACVD